MNTDQRFLKIDVQIIKILVAVEILLTLAGVVVHFTDTDATIGPLLVLRVMFLFSIWLILLNDMIHHRLPNKPFWIIGICVLTTPTSILYLIRRKRMLTTGKQLKVKID